VAPGTPSGSADGKPSHSIKEVTHGRLFDRIYGGWVGMLIGTNNTRPSLPAECKVSDQAATLMRVCERLILAHGGERIDRNGQSVYRVHLQAPRLIEALRAPARRGP